MKASSSSAGRNGLRLRQLQKFLGIFTAARALRMVLEIGLRRQPRAGAVLVPFVEDQPGRRHQVQHRGHDVAGRAAAPAAGNIRESRARIAATGRGPRRNTAARRTGSASARCCRARRPPRRTRATRTATARRNRTRRARSAGDPAPTPAAGEMEAAEDQTSEDQRSAKSMANRNMQIPLYSTGQSLAGGRNISRTKMSDGPKPAESCAS